MLQIIFQQYYPHNWPPHSNMSLVLVWGGLWDGLITQWFVLTLDTLGAVSGRYGGLPHPVGRSVVNDPLSLFVMLHVVN